MRRLLDPLARPQSTKLNKRACKILIVDQRVEELSYLKENIKYFKMRKIVGMNWTSWKTRLNSQIGHNENFRSFEAVLSGHDL